MTGPTRCPYCGTEVSASANYCDRCGTPLRPSGAPTPLRRRERPGRRVAVWLFVVVLLTFFGSGVLGGFRLHSGRWPWSAAVPALAGPDPTEPPSGNGEGEGRYLRAVVSIQVRGDRGSRVGTGFIIDTGGHIVTSAHVIEGHKGCVTVIDDNGTTHQGMVVGHDQNRDVALIYVPTLTKWPQVLTLSSGTLSPGDPVYAWGSLERSPNHAPVPAEVRQVGLSQRIDGRYYADLVEFRGASVMHGASGGPLVHRETGEVVGIVTAGSDSAIAYAIPVAGEVSRLIKAWAEEPVAFQCAPNPAKVRTPVVLATVTPLSGPHGVWGSDMASGAELALRDLEADLLRVGYQVSLVRYDDQGAPEAAAEHARRLAYDQEVIGVVGSFTSPASASLAEGLLESGLVLVVPNAGAEDLMQPGWPHVNRLIAPQVRLEAAAAAYARGRLGVESVLMLLDGSAESERRAAAFETAAEIVALPVAGRIVLPAHIEGSALAAAVRAYVPDAIYYAGNSQLGYQTAAALRQQGLTLPIIGGSELYNPAFESTAGRGWRDIYFTHYTRGTDARFIRHFEAILGKPTRGYGTFGYDAARVILEALIRYGEVNPGRIPDRAEFAALVRSTRGHKGWSTTISFDPNTGENQAAQVYLFQWVDGRIELQ